MRWVNDNAGKGVREALSWYRKNAKGEGKVRSSSCNHMDILNGRSSRSENMDIWKDDLEEDENIWINILRESENTDNSTTPNYRERGSAQSRCAAAGIKGQQEAHIRDLISHRYLYESGSPPQTPHNSSKGNRKSSKKSGKVRMAKLLLK